MSDVKDESNSDNEIRIYMEDKNLNDAKESDVD